MQNKKAKKSTFSYKMLWKNLKTLIRKKIQSKQSKSKKQDTTNAK